MSNDWKEYFEQTKNSKPRPLLVKALSFVKEKDRALDLGSGAFNDVTYLLSVGFKHVVAVDKTSAEETLGYRLPAQVSYVITTFENFEFVENNYDLVNAQYSLPFNPQGSFNKVWDSILKSLKPGGVFVGQLFGDRDEWNTPESQMTFHTKEAAERLLSPLKVVEFFEEDKEGKTAAGQMKHWHVFHFIAIKE